MSTTSNSRVVNIFTGDINLQQIEAAADNLNSPGSVQNYNLATGANTITPPSNATGATIIFPSMNTVLVTLKGVSGDTGIVLRPTDPTRIGLNSTTAFILNAASGISIQIIWS